MKKNKKTPFELHVERWKDCTECELCETRVHTVLARGTVPADILFVGEAPGKTENLTASPFTGDSGRLLDEIIEEALGPFKLTYAITNLIACIPMEEEGGTDKLTAPPVDSVYACSERLIEFADMVDPKLIVCVGKHANYWLETGYSRRIQVNPEIPRVEIWHPGFLLRNSLHMQTLNVRRCIMTIQNAIREFVVQGVS